MNSWGLTSWTRNSPQIPTLCIPNISSQMLRSQRILSPASSVYRHHQHHHSALAGGVTLLSVGYCFQLKFSSPCLTDYYSSFNSTEQSTRTQSILPATDLSIYPSLSVPINLASLMFNQFYGRFCQIIALDSTGNETQLLDERHLCNLTIRLLFVIYATVKLCQWRSIKSNHVHNQFN